MQTESGNKAAAIFGMKEARTPVKESVEYLVATVSYTSSVGHAHGVANGSEFKIDGATREKTSGHFPSIEGEDWPW